MSKAMLEQLDNSGLFCNFSLDAKRALIAASNVKQYAKGEIIYRIGEDPVAMYGILSGAIKLVGENASGQLYVFGLVSPGRWFGENGAIDGEARGQTAITLAETDIMRLPRQSLLNLLEQRPELYVHFIHVFCLRLRLAGQMAEDAAFLPINIRLAKQLLRLDRARKEFEIKLSQEELAASLGVTRQSIFRVLKEWKVLKLVELSYGDVSVLQPEKMIQLVEGFKSR